MGRAVGFVVTALALASATVGAWRAFAEFRTGLWSEYGDGVLFWLKWASDPGSRRLVQAGALALVLVVLAAFSRRLRALAPAALLVRAAGHPAAVALAVVLALLPQGIARAVRPDPAGRPSVVVILLDTVRLDYVGWGGSKLEATPRLDALAARGAAFRQAIAQAPWTKPSVGTLLTGLIPSRHLAVGRPGRRYYPQLPSEQRTVAEAFARQGYATAGVSTNPNILDLFGFRQGFAHWVEQLGWEADDVVAEAERWLGGREEPFFLYLHFNDAHYPYEPREGYRGLFDTTESQAVLNGTTEKEFRFGDREFTAEDVDHFRAAYAEEIRFLDDQVGGFVERLLAERDDVVVVIASDHGEEFLEHGDLGHGHTLFDELLRVPLQVAWSDAIGAAEGLQPGAVVDTQVRLADVTPTLLDLAGLEWPAAAPALDGQGLTGLLRGEEEADRPAFAETDFEGSILSGIPGPLRALRVPGLKWIQTDRFNPDYAGRYWLFDLAADPEETSNLVAERPAQAREWAERLRDSGLLVQKKPMPAMTGDLAAGLSAKLQELGYVDLEPEDVHALDLPLAPGAVPWSPLPTEESASSGSPGPRPR